MRVTSSSADTFDTRMTRATIRISRAEGSRPVIHTTHAGLTEATFAAVHIFAAAINTNGVQADLRLGTVSVGHTLARHHRSIYTATVFTHLALRTKPFLVAGCDAAAIDTESTLTALMVEPTCVVLRSALAIRTHKTGRTEV